MLSAALLAGINARATGSSTWPFWDNYAVHFVSPDGRVIDPDRNQMTTSEGQSYALFFALVANDRPGFEKLLAWTENNLAQGDLSKKLPAWSWGKQSNGSWGVLDSNSASDADLWMAYSLVEAGVLWKNPGYSKKGSALLSHIAQSEVANVPGIGAVLIPGRNGFQQGQDEWLLNPSYSPLPLLMAANHFAPHGSWAEMARVLPGWLKLASPAGFAMDWVKCGPGGCSPATEPGNASKPPRGGYDAIRVYLWAGMTPKETPGAAKLLETFAPMLRYVKAQSAPPESVGADGTVLSASAPIGFDAALIPFAMSAGEPALASQLELTVTATISKSTGLVGNPARYFDQNLALFALGWKEQRFRFAPNGTLRVRWEH
jgi:endo-1,4-beta-D-glucanase Y